jgi:hypothetical protein
MGKKIGIQGPDQEADIDPGGGFETSFSDLRHSENPSNRVIFAKILIITRKLRFPGLFAVYLGKLEF